MTQQYFKVDEEVILESPDMTSINGEYVIEQCLSHAEAVAFAVSMGFSSFSVDDIPHYRLEGLTYTMNQGDAEHNIVTQRVLRKKHNPSEDFQSLINSLNKDKVAS